MSIESKGYIASVKDIEQLVTERCNSVNYMADSRATYLRALIATTQAKLGINPKAVRTGATADAETIQSHALALEEIHTLFYEAVQRAAKTASIHSDEQRPKADVVASRIVFARSAYSTVRSYLVRGKKPLNSIIAAKATKAGLASQTPKRQTSGAPRTIKADTVLKQGKGMLEKILISAQTDKDNAVGILHDLMQMLARGFDDLGYNANKLRAEVDHTATGVISSPPSVRMRKAA